MKRLLYIIILLLVMPAGITFGQARINMNGAYVVNNNVYVVVDNSNTNAVSSTNGGWIIPKSEFSMFTWNIGTATGTYVVPFGDTTLHYLPVSLNISAAGTGSGSVKFSTYHTAALNSSNEPSDVTNLFPFILPGSPSNSDNSYNIVDRFYIIDANGYSTKPTVGNIIFPYVSGTAQTEVGSPNILTESRLMAQRFNAGSNTWSDWFGEGCTDAVASNIGTVQTGNVPASDFFRSWSLWDHTMPLPLKIAGVNGSGCGNNGTITANIYGGKSPYTYTWSNGATTSSISGLSTGTYTVSVSDAGGCASTSSVTITSPSGVVVGSWSTYNVACFGGSTGKAISTVSGGSSPYTYLWSDGQTTGTLSNVTAGSYTLTVTDKNGCTGSKSVTLTQPATALTETITKNNDLTCHALPPLNNPNGSATSNPLGGTSPYVYSWVPSGGTNQTAVALNAGSDNCLVTDAHGCTTTASVTLTQPTVVFATFSHVIPYCYGNSDGTITATGTGGSGIYTHYSWAPYGGTNTTATGLSAQTYTVTITDNLGCLGTAPDGLGQPTPIAVTISGPVCTGNGGKGTVTANATGGTPSYHYTWSNGITTVGTAMRETFVNGSYTVTVGDGHNCPKGTANISFRLCPTELKADDENKGSGNSDNGMNNISVYPNPNNGQFTVTGLDKGMIVEIYDYTGRSISTSSATDASIQLNVSTQPNGIYLIRILDKDGNLVGTKKLIKTQ